MEIIAKSCAIQRFNIHSSNYIEDSVKFIITNPAYSLSLGENNIFLGGSVIYTASGYREQTYIGSNNYFGPSCVISADALILDYCTLDNNVFVGKHVNILEYASVKSSSYLSDYSTIGMYSEVGALSPVVSDIPPFAKVFGNPAKLAGINSSKRIVSMFSKDQVEQIKKYFQNGSVISDIHINTIIDQYKNYSRKKQIK
jgi:Acyl-[acyl carrier protein]--UDP-N-acetylglucosamine O-acyltransferase